ncbi:hypothetical protein BV898_12768 [Hypsibius exemplaris]|uniref:Uncharacterized protein n=1 Tax=Hypsibius exemplaris TaxID=2072580 RepID=A0A1W0WCS0_HYPEX|nr:hypothetical protein BV898_12768 [Hypsibius exemplaris]
MNGDALLLLVGSASLFFQLQLLHQFGAFLLRGREPPFERPQNATGTRDAAEIVEKKVPTVLMQPDSDS